MALTDLLYRCPLCGHDPLPGKGSGAHCPGCGTGFAAVRGGGVSVSKPGHPSTRRSALELSSDLELPFTEEKPLPSSASGGEAGSDHPGSSQPIRETRAQVKIATGQTPIRFQGQVLGFMEEFGRPREGLLRLEPAALAFQPDTAGGEDRWPLDRIRSVQASSSSVQITTRERGLVSIKVQGGSIRLWELLIHQAIQAVWSARGWGHIVEFQPRIRAE